MNSDIVQYEFRIETPRLQLVCCNKEILEAIFTGDESLAALLQINIPVKWSQFGEPAFRSEERSEEHTSELQ